MGLIVFLRLATVVGWFFFSIATSSISTAEETFHSVVKKSVAERKLITSFDFEFKMRTAGRQQSNKPGSPTSDYVFVTDGRIIYDEITSVFLVKTTEYQLEWRSSDSEEEKKGKERWRIPKRNARIRSMSKEHTFNGDAPDTILIRNVNQAVDGDQIPFDFRRFGLALEGDLVSKFSLDRIESNLCLAYPDIVADIDADGTAWFDFDRFQIRMDSKKGFWPSERIFWGRKSGPRKTVADSQPSSDRQNPPPGKGKEFVRLDYCKITPELIDDHWVPKIIETSRPDTSRKIEFIWKSVNKTILPDDVNIDEFIKDLRDASRK